MYNKNPEQFDKCDFGGYSVINLLQYSEQSEIALSKRRESAPAAGKKEYSVSAIDKMMTILEYVKQTGGAYFTDIYTDSDLPKSSTYLLLQSMCKHQLLQLHKNGKYDLGIKLFELGYTMGKTIDIRNVAENSMREMTAQTRLPCMLGILNEDYEGTFVLKIESNIQDYTFVKATVGAKILLHQSAAGKALVAWQKPEAIEEVIKRIDFIQSADNTIISEKAYRKELVVTRKRGHSIDDRESAAYILGIGVPIFDWEGNVAGAISLGGLARDVKDFGVERVVAILQKGSEQISKQMGVR